MKPVNLEDYDFVFALDWIGVCKAFSKNTDDDDDDYVYVFDDHMERRSEIKSEICKIILSCLTDEEIEFISSKSEEITEDVIERYEFNDYLAEVFKIYTGFHLNSLIFTPFSLLLKV